MMPDTSGNRSLILNALIDGLGYEDAAHKHGIPVAEARSIFRSMVSAGMLAKVAEMSRRVRA